MPPRKPESKKNDRRPAAGASPWERLGGKAMDFVANLAKSEADQYLAAFSGIAAPWLKQFALHALPHLKAAASRQHPCEAATVVPGSGTAQACDQVAAVQCAACARPTCIFHAFLTWKGDALCWQCASHTVQTMAFGPRPEAPPRADAPPAWQRPNVPPPGQGQRTGHGVPPQDAAKKAKLEAEIDRSLALLGLERTATWEQVNEAFRQYTKRNHPDRVPQDQRSVAEAQFKQVSAAHSFLQGIGWGRSSAAE